MGGRGSKGNERLAAGGTKKFSGWHYPGFTENVQRLEKAANSARSTAGRARAVQGARDLIQAIDTELQNPEGNRAALRRIRYRAEQVIKRATKQD